MTEPAPSFPLSARKHLATLFILGFFTLLFCFRLTDVYGSHFFERGGIVIGWQAMRILMLPYLLWLQYAVGARLLRHFGEKNIPLQGVEWFIASFLLGSSVWHLLLFAMGLAGLLFYPLMLLLTGGVMLASWPELMRLLSAPRQPPLALDEKLMAGLVIGAALLFLFLKGSYPSGGHDFFNHYFSYYKEVIENANLVPHKSWYHYFYSKGLGMYFLSMILLDPLAIHLIGTCFVVAAAAMLYDLLRKQGESLLLPLFAAFIYLMCYIYTSGRGIFAANGGWGDLEKTHELTAILLLGGLWLIQKSREKPSSAYLPILVAVAATNVVIGFGSGLMAALFFALWFCYCLAMRDRKSAILAFAGGASTGFSLCAILLINWWNTGLPLDQLSLIFWDFINWKKVVELGYTLELYSHYMDLSHYSDKAFSIADVWLKMLVEYYRLYMLWPLLAIAAGLYGSALLQKRPWRLRGAGLILCFLISGYLLALFGGGRSQFISFFRFSSFNYIPMLLLCFLLWQAASPKLIRTAIAATLAAAASLVVWGAAMSPPEKTEPPSFPYWLNFKVGEWEKLLNAAWRLNSGQYSIYNALQDQHGRVARTPWGGVHPAMRKIYDGLPPKTRVWSFYNHSYCLLPACNVQQYFSQITSPRWYDIALSSPEESKKIMQHEGLNFFFYSLNVTRILVGAGTKDQLPVFYAGFTPEHIKDTFGILWSNGNDYLLTWKEESVAPLDDAFMESWTQYYETDVLPRKERFPVQHLATIVKQAVEDPTVTHPPRPDWFSSPH